MCGFSAGCAGILRGVRVFCGFASRYAEVSQKRSLQCTSLVHPFSTRWHAEASFIAFWDIRMFICHDWSCLLLSVGTKCAVQPKLVYFVVFWGICFAFTMLWMLICYSHYLWEHIFLNYCIQSGILHVFSLPLAWELIVNIAVSWYGCSFHDLFCLASDFISDFLHPLLLIFNFSSCCIVYWLYFYWCHIVSCILSHKFLIMTEGNELFMAKLAGIP